MASLTPRALPAAGLTQPGVAGAVEEAVAGGGGQGMAVVAASAREVSRLFTSCEKIEKGKEKR